MSDLDPYSDNPYECLGVSEDASETEVRVAAAKAKSKFNPDNYPEDRKNEARLKVYRVRAAEDAISGSDTYPPDDGLKKIGGGGNGGEGGDDIDSGDGDPESKPKSIEISVSDTRPTVGESIKLTAEVDDDSLEKGTVKVGSERIATIRNGSATLSFEAPGNHEITASSTDRDSEIEPDTQTIKVKPLDRSISMVVDPADVGVGETVQVEIRYDDGAQVSNGMVKTSRGHSVRINRGRAELSFDNPGEVTVKTVLKDDSPSDPAASTTVNVTEIELQLTLEPFEPTISQGESETFTVRDQKGRRVKGAIVSTSTTSVTTDSAGRARLTFDEPGTQTVTAEKSNDGPTYLDASTQATVEAAEVELALELITENLSIGDTVEGTVWTESGSLATGVTVSCLHQKSGDKERKNTDTTGKIRFDLDKEGTYNITAGDESSDTPYIPNSETVSISPETLELTVIPARTEAAVGEEIRFTVRDSRGNRVSSARIQSSGRETKTDARGVGALQFNSAGDFEVEATKNEDRTEFESGHTEVTIIE